MDDPTGIEPYPSMKLCRLGMQATGALAFKRMENVKNR